MWYESRSCAARRRPSRIALSKRTSIGAQEALHVEVPAPETVIHPGEGVSVDRHRRKCVHLVQPQNHIRRGKEIRRHVKGPALDPVRAPHPQREILVCRIVRVGDDLRRQQRGVHVARDGDRTVHLALADLLKPPFPGKIDCAFVGRLDRRQLCHAETGENGPEHSMRCFHPKFLISIFRAMSYLTQRRGEAEFAEVISIAWVCFCFHQLSERSFQDYSCHGFLLRIAKPQKMSHAKFAKCAKFRF